MEIVFCVCSAVLPGQWFINFVDGFILNSRPLDTRRAWKEGPEGGFRTPDQQDLWDPGDLWDPRDPWMNSEMSIFDSRHCT